MYSIYVCLQEEIETC